MSKQMFESESPEHRVEALDANCLSKEKKLIKRLYTPEELITLKDDLSSISVTEFELQEELKEIVSERKAAIKAWTNKKKTVLKAVKDKFFHTEEDVFNFDNQETGMMETYDVHGECIATRKLLPNEKQARIQNIKKVV